MINMSGTIWQNIKRNDLSNINLPPKLPPPHKVKDSAAPIFKAKKSKMVMFKMEKSPVHKRIHDTLNTRESIEYKDEPISIHSLSRNEKIKLAQI